MIIEKTVVESENLFNKLYELGLERVDMIVPHCSPSRVLFEIFYFVNV